MEIDQYLAVLDKELEKYMTDIKKNVLDLDYTKVFLEMDFSDIAKKQVDILAYCPPEYPQPESDSPEACSIILFIGDPLTEKEREELNVLDTMITSMLNDAVCQIRRGFYNTEGSLLICTIDNKPDELGQGLKLMSGAVKELYIGEKSES